MKLDWLDACIALRVVGAVFVVFLPHWRKICTIRQRMERGPIPEEIYQTLLFNKKRGCNAVQALSSGSLRRRIYFEINAKSGSDLLALILVEEEKLPKRIL
jgi:hypothetical protein